MEGMRKLTNPESVATVRRFLFYEFFIIHMLCCSAFRQLSEKYFFRVPNCFVEYLVYATINA